MKFWIIEERLFIKVAYAGFESNVIVTEMSESILNEKKKEYGSANTESEITGEEEDERELTLDEVYEMIGQGPAQYLYWILTGLLAITELADIRIIAAILPSLRCQWNLSPSFESAITLSVFVFYAIFSIVFGKIGDKIGRKVVLKWSVSLLILASIASAFAPDKWVFLIARSVTGACIGINLNCLICYATEFSSNRDRLIGMTVFNGVGSLCSALVYFLSWLILNQGTSGWRWLIVAISSPMIPALVLIILLPGSPRYFVVSGQQDKAIEATRLMAKLNKKHIPPAFKFAWLMNENTGSYSTIFGAVHRRSLVTLSAQYFCNIFIGFAFILYQPLMYTDGCTGGQTNQLARTCSFSDQELLKLVLSTLPCIFGKLSATMSASILGRLKALRISSLIMIFVTAALFFCVNATVIFFVASIINFIDAFINAYLWIAFPEIFPTNIRATAIGFINGCGRIGGFLGSGSVSAFFYVDPSIVAGSILSASIWGFAMSLIYNKETKDVMMKDT